MTTYYKKLLTAAISIAMIFVAANPVVYAKSDTPTPYGPVTCGQCDRGTVFSGYKYEDGFQTIPCTHGYKYGYDYRVITFYVTYNRCSNCSFYETTGVEQVSSTAYICNGSASPVSLSSIWGMPDISTVSINMSLLNSSIPNHLSELVQSAETHLNQNLSTITPRAIPCPGCNSAPSIQHYVTEETIIYSPCVHGTPSANDAWITPVTMYVTDCCGTCGFREIHSIEFGTGYMICLA